MNTRNSIILLLVLIATGCRKKNPERLSALDFLELCAPGGSSDNCSQKIDFTHDALPAGRLDDIFHTQEDVDIALAPNMHPTNGVFVYELQFHGATSEVFDLMKSELGEPAKKLPPYIPATILAGDAYWIAPDGLWELSRGRVAWYSRPFHSYGFADSDRGKLDQYVYPAPYAASIWKKIGLLLISSS
jgi:hypothetical protein